MKGSSQPGTGSDTKALLSAIEIARQSASERLDPKRRTLLGQFLTPLSVASFMARTIECSKPSIRVLDPGAGAGSLCAAVTAALAERRDPPKEILLTAYEVDPLLVEYLRATIDRCRTFARRRGIRLEARIIEEDFLEVGANTLVGNLFAPGENERFDCAILNPPYAKIRRESRDRKLLRSMGLETSNLYTGFLGLTARLLAPGGELVAITPRSFCNGPYFEPFRRFFLREMQFRRIHLFDSRNRAFADDGVLQENVVFRAVKHHDRRAKVTVSASSDVETNDFRARVVSHDQIVDPADPHAFIHIATKDEDSSIRDRIGQLKANLSALGLAVSTGRVVDFRAKELLRDRPDRRTVPLIYPCHFHGGFVEWPNGQTRKPNALTLGPRTQELLVPKGYYVLTKRFSAKEERRRVVAAVYDPTRVAAAQVGFENHLNYYHADGVGMSVTLAKGLAAFLNSTLVDKYFRQFSGHTQVNATDLRFLKYPERSSLIELGRRIGDNFPAQEKLDHLVEEIITHA